MIKRLIHVLLPLAVAGCLPLGTLQAGPVRAAHSLSKGPVRGILVDPVADVLIPMVYDGGGFTTTFHLSNRDSKTIHVAYSFVGANGAPMTLPIDGLGSADTVIVDVPPNQSVTFSTTGASGSLTTGYAWVLTYDRDPEDPKAQITDDLMSGMAILKHPVNGVDVEMPVPITSFADPVFSIPFENRNGYSTGLTLVNPDPQNSTVVNVTLLEEKGQVLQQDKVTVAASAQMFLNLPDRYAASAGKSGRIIVQSDGYYLSGAALRVNSTGGSVVLMPASFDVRLLP